MVEIVELDTRNGVMVERLRQPLTGDLCERTIRDRARVPEFVEIDRIVTDQRGVSVESLDWGSLRACATSARALAEHYAGKRWAVVADQPRTTALHLLLRDLLRDHLVMEVFSTVEAAVEWLDLPAETAGALPPDR